MKRQLSLVILVALAICTQLNLSSCKKSDRLDLDDQEALLMDSTYFFSIAYSLWNTSLPQPRSLGENKLDLRRFTRDYSNAEEVLDALIAKMPRNPTTNEPFDRFSFIDRQGQVQEEIGQGVRRDIGLSPQFILLSQASNDVGLFIRLVQLNSPSQEVGLKRGNRIVAVDGQRISFTANSNGEVQGDLPSFNKIMNGNLRSLTIYDWIDEREYTVEIPNTGSYTIEPFLESTSRFWAARTWVGYLAYDSFVSVMNARTGEQTRYYQGMLNAFSNLSTIDELVVDLRYNGGGAGDAAEMMINIIAPQSAHGKVMYDYEVNDILRTLPNSPFTTVHINKANMPNLGLKRVYFLTSERTASASELVINCLRPHMDVQVISSGREKATYGKPVGFFGQTVLGGVADLYITSFKTINADGYGDYYDGLVANKMNVRDNLNRELSDQEEDLYAEALFHIQTGRYRTVAEANSRASTRRDKGGKGFIGEELNMPEVRPSTQGLFFFDKVNVN